MHMGIDLGRDFSKSQTEILAVAEGIVTNNYWNDTRGWVIIIDHGGFKTLSQHLNKQSPLRKGTKVTAGQPIGIMGATTKTIKNMALHLHFELIVNGKQIDPEPYLKNRKEVKKMLSKEEAKNIIKKACDFQDSTIQYLDSYIYRDALIVKLAEAIQKGGKE